MAGKRSILISPWWGPQRHRGGARQVARRGGSVFKRIVGVGADWGFPGSRRLSNPSKLRRKGRKRTVSRKKG